MTYIQQLEVRPTLGRQIVHDPRSRAFAFPARSTLASVRHPRYVPVFNQTYGSCTGQSAVGCLGTGIFYDLLKEKTLDQTLAETVYSQATKIDPFPGEYPPDDTGSSGLAVAKVVKNLGLISSYSHAFSFEAVLSALQTRPVITGVYWFDSFYYPDKEGIIGMSGPKPAGGHEFVIDEVNFERNLLGCTNSWSTRWGQNGRFYIPFDLYQNLLSMQGDVTIFEPVLTAPVDYDRLFSDQTRTWSNKVHLNKANKATAESIKSWRAAKGL